MTLDRRAIPGDTLDAIRASTWNALLDAGRAHLARQHDVSVPGQPETRPVGIAEVRNNSGATLPYFAAIALREHLFDPVAVEPTFRSATWFEGYLADAGLGDLDADPQRLAVLLEPLGADAIGTACVSGVVPCKVLVESIYDRYASLTDGQTYLTSGSTGPAEILSTPTSIGLQWLYVRVPAERQSLTVELSDASEVVAGVKEIALDPGVFALSGLGGGIVLVSLASTILPSLTFSAPIVFGDAVSFSGAVSFGDTSTWPLAVGELDATVPADPGTATYSNITIIDFNHDAGKGFIVELVAAGEVRVHLADCVVKTDDNALKTALYWLKLEESASPFADSTGNGRGFTGGAGAVQVAGKVNESLKFTGAAAPLTSDDADYDLSADWTFHCFVKIYSDAVFTPTSFDLLTNAGSSAAVELTAASGPVYGFKVAGTADAVSTIAPEVGEWHEVWAWYDSTAGETTIAVDDETPVTVSSTITGSAAANDHGAANPYLYAVMDEVQFWDVVLTSSERESVSNGGEGVTGKCKPVPVEKGGTGADTARSGGEGEYLNQDSPGATMFPVDVGQDAYVLDKQESLKRD